MLPETHMVSGRLRRDLQPGLQRGCEEICPPSGSLRNPGPVEGEGYFKNRWLGHREENRSPCGQGDWGYPKDSFPPLKRGLPSLEEHISRTDAWLKLSVPRSPGVELTPLGPQSLHGQSALVGLVASGRANWLQS